MSIFVYLLRSTITHETYCGITNNLEKRLLQHNGILSGGANSTRRGRPWEFLLSIPVENRSIALKVEYMCKSAYPLVKSNVIIPNIYPKNLVIRIRKIANAVNKYNLKEIIAYDDKTYELFQLFY